MKRRTFLSAAIGASVTSTIRADKLLKKIDASWEPDEELPSKGLSIHDGVSLLKKGEKQNIAPVLREEILDNPNAVFIIKAGITNTRDEYGTWKPCDDRMQRFGRRVVELVFRSGQEKNGRTFLKPNMVGHYNPKNKSFNNGWNVHPYFTVGMVEGLRDMGNTNSTIGIRGELRHHDLVDWGLIDIFNAHNLPVIEAHVRYFKEYRRSELEWHKNPEAIVERRTPTYKPTYQKGTTFINIAHAHTHQLGHTTLTLKNIQGVMPRAYGHVCDTWAALDIWRKPLMKDFNPDYRAEIEKLYVKHANMGYKHWDEGGYYRHYKANGGYEAFMKELKTYRKSKGEERKKAYERMAAVTDSRVFWVEQWAQRMMDIIESIPKPYVSMVEGVFGRGDDCGVVHTDFLTVGRSMVEVDSVTSWLMGHDPGEFPYLRIAKERNLGENDIEKIPIFYLSERGVEKVVDYRTLPRTRLGIYQFKLKEAGARFF